MARRKRACKYGKLKNPVGGRRCRKCPRGGSSRRRRRTTKCKWGKLKRPTKWGRVCKKRRGRIA